MPNTSFILLLLYFGPTSKWISCTAQAANFCGCSIRQYARDVCLHAGFLFDQLWDIVLKARVFFLLGVISSIVLAHALLLVCRANLVSMWPDQVVLPFVVRILSDVKFSFYAMCSWVWAFVKSWVFITNPADFWWFSEGVDRQRWYLTGDILKELLIVWRFTFQLDLQCNNILV